jgi:hypothetical protein
MRELVAPLLLLLVLACAPTTAHDVALGVTKAGIRQLRLGMAEAEVRRLLGEPLSIARSEDREHVVYWYTRSVPGARGYPVLYVGFEQGRLYLVQAEAKVFWGHDEEFLYLLDARNPGGFEADEFEQAFPR